MTCNEGCQLAARALSAVQCGDAGQHHCADGTGQYPHALGQPHGYRINADDTSPHKQIKQEDSKLTNFIPTRSTVEIAELIVDGFNLLEIAETTIYPNFTEDGGVDSERTYIRQLVQKYIKVESKEKLFNDPLNNTSQPPF